MRTVLAVLLTLGLLTPARAADPPTSGSGPAVTISLGARHGHATPAREGFTHTGGGNIDVAQPAPDTVVVTMTGVAVAGGHPWKDSVAALQFDLNQDFEVSFNDPKVKRAKLTLEGRVIGLWRSHCKGGGSAEQGAATAAVTCGSAPVVTLTVPPHAVAGGENLSINCREGPVAGAALAARYTLHAKWSITAAHPRSVKLCKTSSAEFAPDPALDPLWISHWEPFRGAAKKDFGLQLTLKVAPE
jgi:hypothetical protein